MECKDGMVDRFSGNRSRINRNIMECKGMSKQLGAYGTQVLIETLWNVKRKSNTFIASSNFGY